jgi:ferritin-like metal-binding protein YciE
MMLTCSAPVRTLAPARYVSQLGAPLVPPAPSGAGPAQVLTEILMDMETLEDLYVDELKDLWSAEKQILQALPRMIKAATARELKQCVGVEGLLEEGSELIKERPDPDVLDAGLISAAQHVEHYEMAGYGTVRTWAKLTLDEEGDTDKALTKLAKAINVAAESQDDDA